jgi:hypothetical protein
MSRENVELVMGLQRAAEEDFVQLIRDDQRWRQVANAAAPVVHEHAVSARPGIPGSEEYVGLDGFRALWLDWLAPWAEYQTVIEKAIDCGERVLLLQRSSGRMRGSPGLVKLSPAVLWTVQEGKVARFEVYADRGEALKALGLEE